MKRGFFLILLALASTSQAVVIRDDVSDSKYRVPASVFPALADMGGEGHGALIAPNWVVTAAHIAPDSTEKVTINGVPHKVKRTIFHPGYKKTPNELIQQTINTGDGTKIMEFLAASDDIALVELETPVTDVKPVALFRGSDELGKTVEVIGKGATGNGKDGEDPHGMHRTVLRRAFNVVTDVDARWLSYTFDPPKSALPLEGMSGSGDSGGPVLIKQGGQWQLAGLASWKSVKGDARQYKPGRYGNISCNTRISRYIEWIEKTMANPDAAAKSP